MPQRRRRTRLSQMPQTDRQWSIVAGSTTMTHKEEDFAPLRPDLEDGVHGENGVVRRGMMKGIDFADDTGGK
jgi:hypothetical protein